MHIGDAWQACRVGVVCLVACVRYYCCLVLCVTVILFAIVLRHVLSSIIVSHEGNSSPNIFFVSFVASLDVR